MASIDAPPDRCNFDIGMTLVKSQVTLSFHNLLGQQVAALYEGEQEPGYHEVKFDGAGLSSGVDFCRLQAGDFVQTRKLVLL
jgi:hypothetical protein